MFRKTLYTNCNTKEHPKTSALKLIHLTTLPWKRAEPVTSIVVSKTCPHDSMTEVHTQVTASGFFAAKARREWDFARLLVPCWRAQPGNHWEIAPTNVTISAQMWVSFCLGVDQHLSLEACSTLWCNVPPAIRSWISGSSIPQAHPGISGVAGIQVMAWLSTSTILARLLNCSIHQALGTGLKKWAPAHTTDRTIWKYMMATFCHV